MDFGVPAALKRLSNRAYGVIVSAEPAVATLIGALLLGERIGMQGMIAVACVVVAAIGITLTDGRGQSHQGKFSPIGKREVAIGPGALPSRNNTYCRSAFPLRVNWPCWNFIVVFSFPFSLWM